MCPRDGKVEEGSIRRRALIFRNRSPQVRREGDIQGLNGNGKKYINNVLKK